MSLQQTSLLQEISELRTLLQRLRAHGQPRTAEVHDQILVQRFLNLRQAVKFGGCVGTDRCGSLTHVAPACAQERTDLHPARVSA